MPQRKKTILVTRPLNAKQIAFARMLGLEPIVKPTLKVELPEYWDDVLRVLNEERYAAWVFTSRNAVKALAELMDRGLGVLEERVIYAVGDKTKGALAEHGLHAKVPLKQDAEHLADFIMEDGEVDSVVYFRGNRSKRTIPEKLKKAGIEVKELEVYETHLQEIEIPEKVIDAVLFYSPSAVEAFADSGGFENDYPYLFAIGPTTAERLREETDQEVQVPPKPDTNVFLQQVSEVLNRDKTDVE